MNLFIDIFIHIFSGAFYVLDGKEHELNKQIDSKKPVWAVIDIYGNVRGNIIK